MENENTIKVLTDSVEKISNGSGSGFSLGPFAIILSIFGVIALWVITTYNSFIRKRNMVDEAWSDIEIQLKRRYDLIPNLVETVKGYAEHEKSTLSGVIEARAKASSMNIDIKNATAEQLAMFSQAQQGLAGALSKLFALSESYPDLKANENFLELQREITDTEDKIQASRRFFNGTVRDYNTALQLFPSNIVAKMFNFRDRNLFDMDEKERENVKVQF